MKKILGSPFTYQVHFFPGKFMDDDELANFTQELRVVADECFDHSPNYQALTGVREELERCVICVARDKNDRMVGFCSSLVLPVEGVGSVLHLGLTCVHPVARGKKLTHKLLSKLIMKYLLVMAPIGGTWISNVACVISSLGNVAMYFEDVFPSPFSAKGATDSHKAIAKELSDNYRGPLAINTESDFNL